MEKVKRIDWIDMAKGFGIIFVILAHLKIGLLGRWIYSFHMPLFFFLSGYVFSNKKSIKEFAIKKFKSLIIPYIFLALGIIAYTTIYNLLSGSFTANDFFNLVLKFVVQKRNSTLWFLASLFIVNFMFYFLSKIAKSNALIVIISFILMALGYLYYHFGGKPLPWNFDTCFMALPFFAVGFVCKTNSSKIESFINTRPKLLIVLVVCFIINIVCWYSSLSLKGEDLEMFGCKYGFVPLTYISAFAGVAFVVVISKLFTSKAVLYLGKNSLIYFGWHQAIAFPIINSAFNLMHLPLNSLSIPYLSVVIKFVLSVIMLTICNEIILKTKLKFFLGK